MPSRRLLDLWPSLELKESSYLDFKGSLPWNERTRDDLVKDFLGLSNHRDGGFIVIGVEEFGNSKQLAVTGITPDHKRSFVLDNVYDYASGKAQRGLRLEMSEMELLGHKVLVFEVMQFDLTPTICRNTTYRSDDAGDIVLRSGALYCRPAFGKPQTREATADDVEVILDIYYDTRFRRETPRYVELIRQAQKPSEPAAQERYEAERGNY